MPTNRKRRSRILTNPGGLSEAIYHYFAFGPFFDAEGFDDDKDEAELKALWFKYQEQIMERYLKSMRERNHKSRRPSAYFKWTLTEPRLYVGKVLSSRGYWDTMKAGYDGYEADYAYLKRLGLLEPWEMEAKYANE